MSKFMLALLKAPNFACSTKPKKPAMKATQGFFRYQIDEYRSPTP
jgi:hypothetical protein